MNTCSCLIFVNLDIEAFRFMNKYLLSALGLFLSPLIFSQILTVNTGASVSVSSGSSINLDGLEIAPADTYVISGANDVSRSITAVTAGGNNSVLRVYSTSALLSGFTGTLTFSYLDGDVLIGSGFGLRTIVFGLPLRYDVGWAYNRDGFSNAPIHYFSIGIDF